MNKEGQRMKRFMALLSAAHRGKPEICAPVNPQWQADVMRSVRQMGPVSRGIRRPVDFIQLAWRLSPAACLLVLILSICIFQTGYAIYHQMAALSIAEPAQTYLAYIPF